MDALSTADTYSASESTAPSVVPAQYPGHIPDIMQVGQYTVLVLPKGDMKIVEIKPGEITLGRVGVFDGSLLIGKPYGLTFEILASDSLRTLSCAELNYLHDTDELECEENNQNINDDGTNQKLKHADIEQMKLDVLRGQGTSSELIKTMTENNSSFELKTEFSKTKYVARKKAKFLNTFTAVKPCPRVLSQMYIEKNPQKILNLRFDTLAQMFTMANICPGGRYLVVDEVGGLLIGAVIAKLAGTGSVFGISKNDSKSSWAHLKFLNIDFGSLCDSHSLTWETLDTPVEVFDEKDAVDPSIAVIAKERMDRRNKARGEYLKGGFDGLIVASAFNPTEIISKLSPMVAPSRQIVLYHSHLQILMDTFLMMRRSDSIIDTQISENWIREYQILPQRSHPQNNRNMWPGYVISGTTVQKTENPVVKAASVEVVMETDPVQV